MFTADALLRQHHWAHVSYGIMLTHCEKLTTEEISKFIKGFGFPTVRDQLVHIAGAEMFWVCAAQKRQWPHWAAADYETVHPIRPLFEEASAETRGYFTSLSAKDLTEPVRVEWEPGKGVNITPALMLSHIITHGFHHKGQVVAMCRLLGHPAPETDMDTNIGNELD